MKPSTPQQRLIKKIESHQCGASSDLNGGWKSHAINQGLCIWCEISVYGLSLRLGIPAESEEA